MRVTPGRHEAPARGALALTGVKDIGPGTTIRSTPEGVPRRDGTLMRPAARRRTEVEEKMSSHDAGSTKTVLRAEGLSCPSCVAKIEQQVGRLAGVSAVAVRFNSGRIEVEHDPRVASVDELVRAVARAGYTAQPSPF